MTTPTNAWIKLLIGSAVAGLVVYQTAIGGGATQGKSVLAGFVAALTSIYHSLSDGPPDAVPASQQPPKPPTP